MCRDKLMDGIEVLSALPTKPVYRQTLAEFLDDRLAETKLQLAAESQRTNRLDTELARLRAFVADVRQTYPLSEHIRAEIAALDAAGKQQSVPREEGK